MTDRTSGTLNEKTTHSEPSLGGYAGNSKEKIPPLDEYWANQFDTLREAIARLMDENVTLRARDPSVTSASSSGNLR